VVDWRSREMKLGELFRKVLAFVSAEPLSSITPISLSLPLISFIPPTFDLFALSLQGAKLSSVKTLEMANEDVAGVQVYRRQVDNLLDRAAQIKPDKQIEPPLSETHLGESIWHLPSEDEVPTKHLSQHTKVAAVEIAFREKFYRVLVWPVQGSSSEGNAN
jgi:hypothetical protein